MLTRGLIIGKIVDDLASLKYQIETRNKLGQLDLTKFCEDFFKEIFNITYSSNLINLNTTRSNFPGLDLGDERKQVAYQITSQKTSTKITNTLETISAEQITKFNSVKIFIVGEKQFSYTVDDALSKKVGFDKNRDILDIDDLLRDIVLLDVAQLDMLYSLFQREFRQVKIELEPVDEKGNFESSYFNVIEKKPSSPPKNAQKFLGDPAIKGYEREKRELLKIYEKLASVPRVTREILAIIVDRGKFGPSFNISSKYGILPQTLEKIMRMTQSELLTEVNILEDAGLLHVDEGEIGERTAHYLVISGSMLNNLFVWMIEEGMSIRTLLNTMDFTVLDE